MFQATRSGSKACARGRRIKVGFMSSGSWRQHCSRLLIENPFRSAVVHSGLTLKSFARIAISAFLLGAIIKQRALRVFIDPNRVRCAECYVLRKCHLSTGFLSRGTIRHAEAIHSSFHRRRTLPSQDFRSHPSSRRHGT